jgi:hypothetical protein
MVKGFITEVGGIYRVWNPVSSPWHPLPHHGWMMGNTEDLQLNMGYKTQWGDLVYHKIHIYLSEVRERTGNQINCNESGQSQTQDLWYRSSNKVPHLVGYKNHGG